MDRLDKILVSQGAGSRRDVQKLIRKKSVAVNGSIVTDPALKLDPEAAEITVSGEKIGYRNHVYVMMNKPLGVLSATEDKREKTVLDLLPENLRRRGLAPAGRLDKDTTGLLILTDDGEMLHRIISPRSGIFKRYYARLDALPDEETVKKFEEGVTLSDGTKCLPARLEPVENSSAYVEICEGKFHQVKRMFKACGLTVTALKRLKIGGLELDSKLHEGSWRELTDLEKNAIFIGK